MEHPISESFVYLACMMYQKCFMIKLMYQVTGCEKYIVQYMLKQIVLLIENKVIFCTSSKHLFIEVLYVKASLKCDAVAISGIQECLIYIDSMPFT